MTRGRGLRIAAVALTISAAIAGIAVASALALTPPAGTPDLAQMGVQPSDLALGARVRSEGYVAPPLGVLAEYRSAYAGAATQSGTPLAAVDSVVQLAQSPAAATTIFLNEHRVFTSARARRALARLIARAAGPRAHLKAANISFGRLRAAGVGQRSFVQPIVLHERGHRLGYDFLVLKVDRVDSTLVLLGLRPKATTAAARQLGAAVAGHVAAVLATGATGPSGPTGATGATP